MIEDIFKNHRHVLFFYSGGKDSLAVLMLLKNHLDKVEVVWVNPGDPFPEVVEHMKKVRDFVPHFTEIKSDVRSFVEAHGFPVDVVDTRRTTFGNYAFGPTPYKICSRFDCCGCNLWAPMVEHIKASGADCVIRADRGEERAKGIEHADGVDYVFPIFDWDVERVKAFVRTAPAGLYEERHELTHGSSLDCKCCTAYNTDWPSRKVYLREKFPLLLEAQSDFRREYYGTLIKELVEEMR